MRSLPGCTHCAALFLAKHGPLGPDTGLSYTRPLGQGEQNGTITFFRRHGRLFGLTAWHVVETLRDGTDSFGFMTRIGPGQVLIDRFIRCSRPDASHQPIDVAIRELRAEALEAIDKRAIEYEHTRSTTIEPLTHGVAFGFPGELVHVQTNEKGSRLVMPCVHAVAEQVSTTGSSAFQFFSEIDGAPVGNIGGMSGGPVFCPSGQLIGLVVQALPVTPPPGGLGSLPRVHFFAERVTPQAMDTWIAQLGT